MPAAPISRFVKALGRCPLLDARQRAELEELQRHYDEPRALAVAIVRRGWLTTYQINAIAKGRGEKLTVGPYVILDRLGEGGMGHVYKARLSSLDRIVALKVIRPDYLENDRVVRRFQREIRAASQLVHPNVVRAYDADQAGNHHYIAMELVEGIDLARLVKQSGPLPVWQACDLVRQAALGLQHAFERGLVHRDIKPANLLVQPVANGRPGERRGLSPPSKPPGQARRLGVGSSATDYILKITDFGLARWTDDDPDRPVSQLTQLGTVLGTPEYIAPEQVRSSSTCDIRADLYSLGCTFYFLLAGQVPFPNGTLADKLLAHQLDQPEPVGAVRATRLAGSPHTPADSHVPAVLEQVISKLLAKDPAQRYQTPAELADALAGVQNRVGREALPLPSRSPRETDDELDVTTDLPIAPSRPVAKASVRSAKPIGPPAPLCRPPRLSWNCIWPWLVAALVPLVLLAVLAVGITVLAALAR